MSAPGNTEDGGPIPARELLKPTGSSPAGPPPAAGAEVDPAAAEATDSGERSFELDGSGWLVRPAGAGSYGTGKGGLARLLAVHFFREAEPETPIREALVPAGVYWSLRPEELKELFERATPIEH